MKKCNKCLILKPLSEFYIHKQMKDGHLSFCKDCVKKRVHEHYFKDIEKSREKEKVRWGKRYSQKEFRKYWNKRSLLYRKRNKLACKAHSILNGKIRNKSIERPTECSICKMKNNLVGHHKDYNFPLKVIWVCPSCHHNIHKKTSENNNRHP